MDSSTSAQAQTRTAMHVLLVDDDPFALDTMGMILEMDGYLVTFARCSRKALEAVERKGLPSPAVDLMIVDLEMADNGGIELIEEMKLRKLQVPMLVVTEFTARRTVLDLLRQGVMDYLDKPVQMQEFRSRVAHMALTIQRRRSEKAGLPAPAAESPARPSPSVGASASTVDTSDCGLPHVFKSWFLSSAGRVAALACRRDYGCDLLTAEVAGESLEAFCQTVVIKSCFDRHKGAGLDGVSFVRYLNKSLLAGSLGRCPARVLFTRVFTAEKRMEIISAGNPFISHLAGASPHPRTFFSSGEALGISEDVRVEPRVVPVESGDRIFLYSRSFVAASRRGLAAPEKQNLGPEAMDDLIMAYRKGSLDMMVQNVWRHVSPTRERSEDDLFFWGLQVP